MMSIKNKKIAIIHDIFLHIGGAEKVLFQFIDAFPEADIYIPLISGTFKKQLKTKGKVYTSFFSALPYVEKFASLLKPLILIYWELLNLEKYDLIISSSHSFSSKSVNTGKKARHISYIHTPPRYLYNEYNQMSWIKKFPYFLLFWPIFFVLRKYDYYSAQKPDLLIANSRNVQNRIKIYYKRSSTVIYPPHNTAPKSFKKKKGEYFLFFSRLEKQKGAELIVQTCTKYQLPLVIVGTGSQEKYLRSIAGSTVTFKGFISEEEKIRVFANAKALLYAAIDEDYGMVIPEILSYSIPVIAYDSIVLNEFEKKDIITFKSFSSQAIFEAIQQLK